MTEGISKERLIELKDTINDKFETGTPTHNVYSLILNQLISECTELDPWLLIDENTPKDLEKTVVPVEWIEEYNDLVKQYKFSSS